MKKTLLFTLILLCSYSIKAQRKSKFNTMDKGKTTKNIKWNGSLSYGNTLFLGDLRHDSQERYLPNVALSVRFNKEKNHKKGYQLAVTAGKNSGESDFDVPSFNRFFRSQYLQGHIAIRRAISKHENVKNGNPLPQAHLLFGAGYYIADVKRFDPNVDNFTPDKHETIGSYYFPLGIEFSYYLRQGFGFIASLTNNLYLNDKIDLYEVQGNGTDNQLMFNLGMCFKFN
jgi:hypothetical protein